MGTKCAVSGPIFIGHGRLDMVARTERFGCERTLMLYKTLSAAVFGIDASIIEVEVDVSDIKTNEDSFHTVGLPDAAVRVRSLGGKILL